MPRARFLALALMACLGLPGVVWAQAQATTGAIQGLVTDPSGAVVAEAKVEAKNLDTNFVRTQDTDAYGRFVLLQMPPGRYTVRVSKPGFATLVQEAVVLTVGEALNLALTMKVSAVEETVTVSGQAGFLSGEAVSR